MDRWRQAFVNVYIFSWTFILRSYYIYFYRILIRERGSVFHKRWWELYVRRVVSVDTSWVYEYLCLYGEYASCIGRYFIELPPICHKVYLYSFTYILWLNRKWWNMKCAVVQHLKSHKACYISQQQQQHSIPSRPGTTHRNLHYE